MAFKHIQNELKDGVAFITLNRPPLNWLNLEMMEEFNIYVQSLMKEKTLKLLVIQAMGKAFSVGVEVADHLGEMGPKMIETFHKMFRLMDALKVPSIGVVNGAALGGGCELALYCDMVIATERAKFGQPEIQVGVFPPIAALILPRMIGRKKAMELILSGKIISAEEAYRIGLINEIFTSEDLVSRAKKMGHEIGEKGSFAIEAAIQAINEGLKVDVEQGMKLESQLSSGLIETKDMKEGISAFFERRKPVFRNS